jgi:hypothetical protein
VVGDRGEKFGYPCIYPERVCSFGELFFFLLFSSMTIQVAAVLLGALSYNWLSAFLFLFEVNVSPRVEKGIVVGLVLFLASLSIFGAGFGIAQGIYATQYSQTIWTLSWNRVLLFYNVSLCERGFQIVAAIFMVFCLLASLFLVVSSGVGFFVLRKRRVSRDNLLAVTRFFGISFFLLVGMTLRLTQFLLVLPMSLHFPPRWFQYGLVYIGAVALMTLIYLLFCFFAFHSTHPQRIGKGTEMSTVLLLEEEKESIERRRTVPRAYEI